MPAAADAEALQARKLERSRATLMRDVDRIWADLLDPTDVPKSLSTIGPLVAARVAAGQAEGLDAALVYVDAVMTAAFGAAAVTPMVPPDKFIGFDRYGRSIPTMLQGAAATWQRRTAGGMNPEEALQRERTFQSRLAGSAVHDTDRSAIVGMANPKSGYGHPQAEGWARVAHAKACDFCVMLAGRGFVYTSEANARAASSGAKYHDHCRCTTKMGPRGTRDAAAEAAYKKWADDGAQTRWGPGSYRAKPKPKPVTPKPAPPPAPAPSPPLTPPKFVFKDGKWVNEATLPKETSAADTSLFGVPRGDPMDHDAAFRGTNPKYKTDPEYGVNCARCVTTYEARRRGWDIEAARGSAGANREEMRIKAFGDVRKWKKPQGGLYGITEAVKKGPVGGRYWVTCVWKSKPPSAHVFVIENRGGAVKVFDPQTGNQHAYSSYVNMVKNAELRYMQVDDLPFAPGAGNMALDT